jgi:hypothetical protein
MPPPALSHGFVTFGCYNNLPKLSPTTIHLWAKILHTVPNSRLVLKTLSFRDPETQALFWQHFSEAGIPRQRIDLLPPTTPLNAFLAEYARIDIARPRSHPLQRRHHHLRRPKKEFTDMYTEEDFWRDNPSPSDPFVFPWERDYHQQQVEKAEMDGIETGIEKGIEKGKMKVARAMLAKGMEISLISEMTGLEEEQITAKSEHNGSQ